MNRKNRNKFFNRENKDVLVMMLVCSVLITSVIAINPSFSKYVWEKAYDISVSSAAFGEEYIPLTEVLPTYDEETLPPGGDPVDVSIGETVVVHDPETGSTYYVVVKEGGTLQRNEDGTLYTTNPNALLQINEKRLDWYSDISHPNYTAWNTFYASNTWVRGDILIWHFNNPEQTRTFVWNHTSMMNEQPPGPKWVEITP
jgi:hypothetical protein